MHLFGDAGKGSAARKQMLERSAHKKEWRYTKQNKENRKIRKKKEKSGKKVVHLFYSGVPPSRKINTKIKITGKTYMK